MLKKLLSLFLVVIVAFMFNSSCAEIAEEELETEVTDFMEELEESDRAFTIPINVGPVYSIILHKGGVGIAFSTIKSKSISLALEAVSFLMDLKEMDVHLQNGTKYTIPAVVQVLNQDVGTFIVINLTEKAAKSIVEIVSSGSPVIQFSFIQKNNQKIDMSVDDVNQALTKATGDVTDIMNQAGQVIGTFWNNFSSGIGKFAEDAYTNISKAMVDAGDYIVDTANNTWNTITDAADTAGNFLGGVAESAGDAIGGAMDSAGSAIEGAVEDLGQLWTGLWGH